MFRCNEINKVKTYSLRKQNDNNSIEYQKINENSIYNKKFDCIISFESIQPEQYFIQIIEKFDKLLKDNGMLILSALNKEFLTNFVDSKNPSAFKGVTKGEFLRFLGDRFKESKLFSQRIFSKNEINHISPSDLFLFEDDIPLSIIKKRDDYGTKKWRLCICIVGIFMGILYFINVSILLLAFAEGLLTLCVSL